MSEGRPEELPRFCKKNQSRVKEQLRRTEDAKWTQLKAVSQFPRKKSEEEKGLQSEHIFSFIISDIWTYYINLAMPCSPRGTGSLLAVRKLL